MHEQPSPQKRADEALGKRIKKAREAAGLSQRELAVELKTLGYSIDPSAVTRIERGERPLKLAEAINIASVLSTTVGLLTGEQDRLPIEVTRARANAAMHNARGNLSHMLTNMAIIQSDLRRDPRAMSVFADEDDAPATPEDYLGWVRTRVQGLTKDRDWRLALAETPEDAAMLRNIAKSLISHLVEVDPMWFDITQVDDYDDDDLEQDS